MYIRAEMTTGSSLDGKLCYCTLWLWLCFCFNLLSGLFAQIDLKFQVLMKFIILFCSVSAVSVVQSYYTLIFRFSVFMQLTATLLLFWVTFTPKPRDTEDFCSQHRMPTGATMQNEQQRSTTKKMLSCLSIISLLWQRKVPLDYLLLLLLLFGGVCSVTFVTWSCRRLEDSSLCSPSGKGRHRRSCRPFGHSWRFRS